jgi:aryl-alcohol dehydrogenase-like predicted oxidoreductase
MTQSDSIERKPGALLPVLGRSGLPIGFGTGSLLRIGTARERANILAAALSCGITHYDSAPLYGFGESERALGRVFSRQRSRVTLTTKFGLQPSRFAARLAPLQRAGRRALRLFPSLRRVAVRNSGVLYAPPSFSVSGIRDSLESSLRSLQTDYVDLFLAHQASAAALPDEDVIGLLEDLRRAGKIRAFGVATEFELLGPVLQARPQLGQVVQFDSELTSRHIAALESRTDRLLITYGFINRAIAVCRERLQVASPRIGDLEQADDDTLGGLLLRAAVLANPNGIVLTQSRSPARIKRNAQAVENQNNDELARRLARLLESGR